MTARDWLEYIVMAAFAGWIGGVAAAVTVIAWVRGGEDAES